MKRTLLESTKRKLVAGAVCSLVAASLAVPSASAYAITAAEAQASADAALNELYSLQEVQAEKSNAYFAALEEYAAAVNNRDQAAARITEIQDQIAAVQTTLGSRAREMYRDGSTSFIDVLLGSTSFAEFSQNWELLNKINQNDANNIKDSKILKKQVSEQKVIYEQAAAEAEVKANEASEAYQQAVEATEEMEATYASLSAEAQELYQQEAAASAADAYAAAAAEYGATYNSDGTVYDSNTGTTYSSISEYASATGNDIVDRARAMIGSAYVWGGVGGSDGGFDCSGLVSYAVTGTNTRLGSSYTFEGYNQVTTAQPGDIIVTDGHTGIVSGVDANGNVTSVIHAINESQGVQETGVAGYFDNGYIVVQY